MIILRNITSYIYNINLISINYDIHLSDELIAIEITWFQFIPKINFKNLFHRC